jgi:putative ABC transport system substrate-binding protein
MRRREFIAGLGGMAAAWPLAAGAQQRSPVVGVLSMGTPEASRLSYFSAAFRQASKETGFVEGQNVTFEFRNASGHYDRLPALAAGLVEQRVDVIVAGGPPGAIAAKSATAIIPIVFHMGEDPVKEGIVPSLNRPGGNVTGVTTLGNQLMAKIRIRHQPQDRQGTRP